VAATLALTRLGARLLAGLTDRLSRDLTHFGDAPLQPLTAGAVNGIAINGLTAIAVLVGPIALATATVSFVTQGVQGGWTFSSEALRFKWDRLNPATGIKRLGFSQSGLDTLKTMVIVAVIAWLAWGSVKTLVTDSNRMAWMSPVGAAALGWSQATSLLWKIAWGLGALAIADYGLQYYRLMSSLKMSKQEIRDEARGQDGSPEMKMRVRRIQRDMARRRMISDVARATVVITNPTHYAVALEYRRGSMAAPVVVAKGRDHIAAAIRAKAREHGIPLFENKPLAQTLFKTAEVGEAIPGALFAAVAEVLAQLIRSKRLSL
jgi:flagellar biosynthetic protein FlhB